MAIYYKAFFPFGKKKEKKKSRQLYRSSIFFFSIASLFHLAILIMRRIIPGVMHFLPRLRMLSRYMQSSEGVKSSHTRAHTCLTCVYRNRNMPVQAVPCMGIHVRVYISRTMAHTPSYACPRLNPFNVLFVFLIVSVYSCVNRWLSESGKTIDEDG